MADNFDLCECVWSHEMAMRRLLSMLRQGQSYCTETECLEELPGITATGASNNFVLMSVLFLACLFLYAMRPGRDASNTVAHEPVKPLPPSHGGPPAPPELD